MIENITNWFKELFHSIWEAFVEFLKTIVLTIFDMLKDVMYFIFDAFLSLAFTLLDAAFAMLDLINVTQYVSALPSDALNIMGLIGIGEAIGLVAVAIIIRLTLQLIPFTRLGS